MAYVVEFDKRATKDLSKLPSQVARVVVEECSILKENPLQGPGIKRLTFNLYRLEILHVWRAVYLVEGSKVLIILIGHRRDCYKRLERRL